ncbi:MAG: ATP-binding protein [Gammaproteobacteria bacterium]|nr:ATP-binding protein [Gammaproteobacteria bacterium]
MGDGHKRRRAVLKRLERLLDRAEVLLPAAPDGVLEEDVWAWRWRRQGGIGGLRVVRHLHDIGLAELHGVERQKILLERNTRQFLAGLPANNALLWGARGTGKSSLVKALLNAYGNAGLRVVEVDREELADLPEIIDLLQGRPERFIIFSDDLSFEQGDASFKALKGILDGSVAAVPSNVLIYATSNRRHLVPEYFAENDQARNVDGEIHHGEAVEEKISLAERFGLWLSFYPFDQDTYLGIVAGWLETLGFEDPNPELTRREALRWALGRGSRSGRAAQQFARDWVGHHGLEGPGAPPMEESPHD